MESEYKALAHETCELLWVQALLKELGVFISQPPILYYDNLGATYLFVNLAIHSQIKHVDIDYHFVKTEFKPKCF